MLTCQHKTVPAVLSIAGSDSSGGAGIQADIKTIAAHSLFAETALTAVTVQNTLGVYGVEEVSSSCVAAQIDAVFDDIRPAAVKIGMVSSRTLIEVIAERLLFWQAENIVVDPVMVATSGGKLISDDAVGALKEALIPLASVITPNLSEAEVLTASSVVSEKEREQAGFCLKKKTQGAVLIKGGHDPYNADDVLITTEGETVWLRERRIATSNTHGTGCTLSSAIACNLAVGCSVVDAVSRAKAYVTGALSAGLALGRGSGPLDHMWQYR